MPLTDTLDALETWYNDGFLIGLCQAAEVSELQPMGTASIARRRATIDVNARSLFPRSSRRYPTNRIGNVKTGRREL